ncbi:hypothetical protein Dimus_002166 [Dionaea muscipula]
MVGRRGWPKGRPRKVVVRSVVDSSAGLKRTSSHAQIAPISGETLDCDDGNSIREKIGELYGSGKEGDWTDSEVVGVAGETSGVVPSTSSWAEDCEMKKGSIDEVYEGKSQHSAQAVQHGDFFRALTQASAVDHKSGDAWRSARRGHPSEGIPIFLLEVMRVGRVRWVVDGNGDFTVKGLNVH